MGLRESIVNALAGSQIDRRIKDAVEKKINETSFGEVLIEANQSSDKGGKNEDWGYRKMTSGNIKQFNPVDQAKMQKICYWLYDMNGIAHRAVERIKDFVVGDGLNYTCEDKEVKDVIDEHWEDDQNRWELKQYQKVMELSIYGEQFYPAFVNDTSGKVRLGYVDPELVTKVETDPENAEKQILFRAQLPNATEAKPYKIINLNTETDLLEGDAFFFSINTVANQPRGRSDLLTTADNIDLYEQYLFNRAERADLLTRIIWDLKCTGMTVDEIKVYLKKFKPPKANEVFGHNEKMELNQKSPELGSQDAATEAKLLFNHILAGLGFPPHWFASPEGLNRSTAMAMDLPTKKQLKTRQRYFRWMVSYIFRYCIHQAIEKGKIKDKSKKDTKININLPKIEEKEIEIISGALVNLASSLVTAEEESWISKENAAKVYVYVLGNIGMEVEEAIVEQQDPNKKPSDSTVESMIDKRLRQIYSQKTKPKEVKNPPEEE